MDAGVRFSDVDFGKPVRPGLIRRAVSDFAAPPGDLYEITVSPKTSFDSQTPMLALNDRIMYRRRSSALSSVESAGDEDRAAQQRRRLSHIRMAQQRATWLYCALFGAVIPASIVFGMWLSLRFLQPVAQGRTEL